MRLALALGVAFGALTMSASAQPEGRAHHRVFIHAAAGHDIDADDDGFITRAEMTAAADRLFGDLDRNDDGRLTEIDHPPMEEFDRHIEGHHGGEDGEHHGSENAERHVERHIERDGDDDRNVIILRGEGGEWTHGPGAPMPPHPPMLMFASNNIEEFDRNGDGALSQQEFRAQQLAQFDAQDGNRDGRIRAMRMPEPPTPPEAPQPPEPPRRR
jgi:hypothetical protein